MSDIRLNSTSAEPHILCDQCKSFWARATCFTWPPEQLEQGGGEAPWMPQHVLLSRHRSAVQSGASSGCHFCSIILASFVGCTGEHGDRKFVDAADGPIYASIELLVADQGAFLLTLFDREQSEITNHDEILGDYPIQVNRIQENAGTPSSLSLQSLPSRLERTTFSENTARFIRDWISECQTSHDLCGDDFLNLLVGDVSARARPKRLLDLRAFDDLDSIRLVEVDQSCKWEYCAISYSWGYGPRFVMTSENIEQFRNAIQVRDMPRLLQDAVHVVRCLHYRYLWIDALCMMQDGRSSAVASADWNSEILKMKDIFGNATVVVAAAECFDATESIIRQRNPLSHLTCRLDVSTHLSYEVVPRCTPHCLNHPFDKARYHLDTRAWVFQERILAPRTLHFTRNFVHLECRTELCCGAMDGAELCHHSGVVAKLDYQVMFAVFGPDGLDPSHGDAFLSSWHELVRKFSTLSLSHEQDYLLALDGLVKQLQSKSNLTFSYGLWREYILKGLLWYVRAGIGYRIDGRAPTWSWASIEVDGPYNTYEHRIKLQQLGPQILYEPSKDVTLLADLISLPAPTECKREAGSHIDESKHCVRVAGLLRPGAPDRIKARSDIDRDANHDIRVHRNCAGWAHVHRQCPFHPDWALPDNIELYSLLMACSTGFQSYSLRGEWDTHVGLVLTPAVARPGRYHRVGYFHIDVVRETEQDAELMPWVLREAKWTEVEIL